MQTLKTLALVAAILAFAVPAVAAPPAAAPVAEEAPASEIVSEVAPETAPEATLDLLAEPVQTSYCATFLAHSWSDCEQGCYARGCGLDHWNSSTCDCYCGWQF